MRKIVAFFCLIAFCCLVGKGIHFAKKGFNPRRIALPVPTELVIWNPEADRLLEQPFRYLGRGRQCFAFSSPDGKVVLKLPRTDIYQVPFWMRVLPVTKTRESVRETRLSREKLVLNSMRIAYEEMREDTGV